MARKKAPGAKPMRRLPKNIPPELLALLKGAESKPLGSGAFWKPQNEGDFVVGRLVNVRRQKATKDFDARDLWDIEQPDGKKITVGLTTVLENLVSEMEERPTPGMNVAIVYRGLAEKAKKGHNRAKLFTLEVSGKGRKAKR